MGIMNSLKSGADLTHPKMSFGWMTGAVIAIALIGIAFWLYNKLKSASSGITGKVSSAAGGLESQASKQLDGFL